MALIAWRGRIFIRPLPSSAVPLPAWCSAPLLLAALGLVVVPLWPFAAGGFAPDGNFPAVMARFFVLGVVLVFWFRNRPLSRRVFGDVDNSTKSSATKGLQSLLPGFCEVVGYPLRRFEDLWDVHTEVC